MSEQGERPLWKWVLLALSPALAYDALASLSPLSREIASFNMFVGMLMPFVIIIGLIVLANRFFKARGDASVGSRVLFVLGFGLLNAGLWLGGCAMTLSHASFH
jgi:hypothetical protein